MDKSITNSGITTNSLLCRQQLDATTKKISNECEHKSKSRRHHQGSSSHHSKSRGNLNHPKIPPPPPPDKANKSINYALRQNNIEETAPFSESHHEEISTTVGEIDNLAFIKHGQKESEEDMKGISLPVHPHQRHLSNSQYVITSMSASSNVKSSSFDYEGIKKEDFKEMSILKTASYKDNLDERKMANTETSDILSSELVLLTFSITYLILNQNKFCTA